MRGGLFLLLWLCNLGAEAAADGLRIKQLQRCGDLLGEGGQQWCLRAEGLGADVPKVWLGGVRLPTADIERKGDRLILNLAKQAQRSAPLWLEYGGRTSNPIWLTRQRSHVVAAGPDEVAKNMDGLTTYVDLVSLLIEEKHDGFGEARRIAGKYGAQVVGAIPPLNVYQLRLPVDDLVQRDAMILRMGSEVSVDAVIVEESAPERGEEGSGRDSRAIDQADEWAANRFMDALYFYQRRIGASRLPVQPVRVGVIEREVDFDAPGFSQYRGGCEQGQTCLYARDGDRPTSHGSHVAGILAAQGEGFFAGAGQAQPWLRGDCRAQLGCRYHRQHRCIGEPGRGWRAGAELELGHPPGRRTRRQR